MKKLVRRSIRLGSCRGVGRYLRRISCLHFVIYGLPANLEVNLNALHCLKFAKLETSRL